MSNDTYQLGPFNFEVPSYYSVEEIDPNAHLDILTEDPETVERVSKIKSLLGKVVDWNKMDADLEKLKKVRQPFYRVHMQGYVLNVSRIPVRPPIDSLEKFLLVMADQKVKTIDIAVGILKGSVGGWYSEEYTAMNWWLFNGDEALSFNLAGPGEPSDLVKRDVEAMVNSVKL